MIENSLKYIRMRTPAVELNIVLAGLLGNEMLVYMDDIDNKTK